MKNLLSLFLILFMLAGSGCVQKEKSSAEINDSELTDQERMAWWHEARFGMFIHWGVYALYGGVYDGHEQVRNNGEWIMNFCKIPVGEYQEKAREFNPVNYDPEAWVKMAKDAGMKYIVITSKHHDGFALFDSEASNWNVVDATVYGKDLLEPLAEACRNQDMKLGFYYSQAQDWNNPGGTAARKLMKDGWPNPDSAIIDAYTKEHNGHWDPAQETATFEEYIDRVAVPQVREILTNYGELAVLWWDTPVGMTDEAALKLQELLALQPGIITNDRLKRPNFPGDTKTPEQRIPGEGDMEGENWETCMTMNRTWGYRLNDHDWKSTETLIRNLVDIASKGGNYLLNVGPKPDGTFPEESVTRLEEIGKWMDVNGEAIYGTQGSPFGSFPWGRCTMKAEKKGHVYYFSIFKWPEDNRLVIPGLSGTKVKANMLRDGKKLAAAECPEGLCLELDGNFQEEMVPVVRVIARHQ